MPLSSASDKSAPPGTMPLSSASDKSAPPGTMPLSSTSDKSLPLCHQWKRYLSIGAAPPDRLSSYGASSCTSKTYKISIQKPFQKAFIFGVEITPSLWRRYSKASRGSGFVKMSATCSFVPTYSTLMFFSATYSHRK
jgi:hypothetical protein